MKKIRFPERITVYQYTRPKNSRFNPLAVYALAAFITVMSSIPFFSTTRVYNQYKQFKQQGFKIERHYGSDFLVTHGEMSEFGPVIRELRKTEKELRKQGLPVATIDDYTIKDKQLSCPDNSIGNLANTYASKGPHIFYNKISDRVSLFHIIKKTINGYLKNIRFRPEEKIKEQNPLDLEEHIKPKPFKGEYELA